MGHAHRDGVGFGEACMWAVAGLLNKLPHRADVDSPAVKNCPTAWLPRSLPFLSLYAGMRPAARGVLRAPCRCSAGISRLHAEVTWSCWRATSTSCPQLDGTAGALSPFHAVLMACMGATDRSFHSEMNFIARCQTGSWGPPGETYPCGSGVKTQDRLPRSLSKPTATHQANPAPSKALRRD